MSGISGAPAEGGAPALPAQGSAQATVARNTAFLIAGQVLSIPLSLALNGIMARALGADDFGLIYLAMTFLSFSFLAVEWGQTGSMPPLIVRAPQSAGTVLGTAVVWRLALAIPAWGVLAVAGLVLGYGPVFQLVLALTALARLANMIGMACITAARGLENTSLNAVSSVRYGILCVAFVAPAAWLGGKVFAVLVALFAADAINSALLWRAMRTLGIRGFHVDRATMRALIGTGTAFMVLAVAVVLQPNVDAFFLSKLGTTEEIGWYAVTRKLVGALVFPVAALQGALYPTLCRLFVEDKEAFRKMMGTALRTCTLLVVPAALGTGLYPNIGVMIFSEAKFRPAEDDLRVMAIFVLFVYFTMVVSIAITAAGRARAWSIAQLGCVAVSAIADPVLIPWFHRRVANGGLGVCVSSTLSELLMLVSGFWIAPRGLLDRALFACVARAFLAGGAMTAVWWLSRAINPFASAAAAIVAYGVCLALVGGLDRDAVETFRSAIGRKLGGARAKSAS